MVDVTSANLLQVLPELVRALDQAAFVAIDTELTGVQLDNVRPHIFDSPAERYLKLRQHVNVLLVIQLGIAAFRFDTDAGRWTAKVYRIYVFPDKPSASVGQLACFSMQPASMRFLAGCGFDFNRLFRIGVPWLRVDEEAKLRSVRQQKQQQQPPSDVPIVSGSPDAQFVEECKQTVKSWLEKLDAEQPQPPGTQQPAKTLLLPRCSAFRRRLLYQELGKVFPSTQLRLETIRASEQIQVTRLMANSTDSRREEEETQIRAMVGVRLVMDALVHARKPLVGHNMLLDVLHIYGQFFEPLPSTLVEFKQKFSALFPTVYDTKYLSTHSDRVRADSATSASPRHQPQSSAASVAVASSSSSSSNGSASTNLEALYALASLKQGAPDVEPFAGELHDSGFDAYVTGVLFVRLLHEAPPAVPHPHANRVYLMFHADLDCIQLTADDPPPMPRPNTVHVSGFSAQTRADQLLAMLAPTAGEFGPLRCQWIDDTSTFVVLENAARAAQLLERFASRRDPLRVVDYETFRATVTAAESSSADSAVSNTRKRKEADT